MSTATVIPIALSVIDNILGMFPNYDERKKEKYNELKERFENEKNSVDRDDFLVDELRNKLRRHIESIITDIPG